MTRRRINHRLPAPTPDGFTLRDGFTLLELLIVGVLVSVLMLAVWSLFRTWSGLYEKGQRRTQEAQLIRSLCDQLTDDLHSVTYVPPLPSRGRRSSRSSSSNSSGSGFALTGASDWLILDVIQPANPFGASSGADEELGTPVDAPMVQAPELQRIIYTFVAPELDTLSGLSSVGDAAMDDTVPVDVASPFASDLAMAEPFYGLLRVVVARELFDQVAAANSSLDLQPALAIGGFGGGDPGGGDPQSGTPGVIEQDEVPEVQWLEFRYYDGTAWLASWDSRIKGQLPVAVEIRFELARIEDEAEAEVPDPSGDDTELVTDDELLAEDSMMDSLDETSSFSADGSSGSQPGTEETPYHRCVIYLGPAK